MGQTLYMLALQKCRHKQNQNFLQKIMRKGITFVHNLGKSLLNTQLVFS
jgi:hypothetical protein